jgi:hypothetical protein
MSTWFRVPGTHRAQTSPECSPDAGGCSTWLPETRSGNVRRMSQRPEEDHDPAEPDPLDQDAAEIDPRSDEAAEDVEELIEHAEELGRDPDQEVITDPDTGQ